jgi:hypothetical protein
MTHLLLLGLAGDVPTAACAADRVSLTQNHGGMKLIVLINAIAITYQNHATSFACFFCRRDVVRTRSVGSVHGSID